MGYKKRLSQAIKNQDMFGHQVALNFNRQGNTFNTVLGGLVSVVLKVLILGFICFKTYVLVNLQGNSYVTISETTDYTQGLDNTFKTVEFLPYFVVKDRLTNK